MAIAWQGLTGWVQQQVAAVQSAAKTLIDASVGSLTLAWAQAVGGVALWLQAQVAAAVALTRFQTSYGTDADSWGGQFSFSRLPPIAATSTATFSRYTTTQKATILAGSPVGGVLAGGAVISTGPGGPQYMVTVDTGNALYSAAAGGYVIPAGTASATAPIQALVAGSGGNVGAGTITSFYQPLPGLDTVTNPAAVTNGNNAEPDQPYKARFPVYLAGLASADAAAIKSAIMGVQQGIQYALFENLDYPGTATDNGNFFVAINDGSGSPPAGLLTLVNNAVGAVRAFTVRYQGAYAPTLVTPSIAITVRYSGSSVAQAVIAAIVTAVNATPLNALWLYVETINSAAKAVPGVASVQPGTTTINAANADLALLPVALPQITSTNIVVSTY